MYMNGQVIAEEILFERIEIMHKTNNAVNGACEQQCVINWSQLYLVKYLVMRAITSLSCFKIDRYLV